MQVDPPSQGKLRLETRLRSKRRLVAKSGPWRQIAASRSKRLGRAMLKDTSQVRRRKAASVKSHVVAPALTTKYAWLGMRKPRDK